MSYYISACPIGVFASDSNGSIKAASLFSKDKRVQEFLQTRKESVSDKEKEVLAKVKDAVFERKKEGYKHEFPNPCGDALRKDLAKIVKEHGGIPADELREILYFVNYELTKRSLRESVGTDKMIIQAVATIDEMDRTANVMTARLREWYGHYFPELSDRVTDHKRFASIVAQDPFREKNEVIDCSQSVGGELDKVDIVEFQTLAASIEQMYIERGKLERYIEKRVKEYMPNTEAILGSIITARMLAIAGDLKRLSSFPSSTIQVLGAERALFRFLSGSGSPPKHGLLFQHPFVNQTPRSARGKAARMLASKVSITLKVDYFGGKFAGDKMREDFEKKLANLRKEAKTKKKDFKGKGKKGKKKR